MKPRGLVVCLLAARAFLALYAVGVAREDSDAADLAPPTALPGGTASSTGPPNLARPAGLAGLKPARRRAARRAASPAPASAPASPSPAPAPAPAPAPTPAPQPAPPSPPSGGGGQPFFNEG